MSSNYDVPEELLYTKEHEWARIMSKETVQVGITSYAAEQLHDVVFVELPKIGANVVQGKSACVVESVKSTSDVMAPFSGKVVEVNQQLEMHPEKVNQDPYGEGWFFVIEVSNMEDEKGRLLSAEEYKKYLQKLTSQ